MTDTEDPDLKALRDTLETRLLEVEQIVIEKDAEIERLRKALAWIANQPIERDSMRNTARNALQGESE